MSKRTNQPQWVSLKKAAQARRVSPVILAHLCKHAGQRYKRINGVRVVDARILKCVDALVWQQTSHLVYRSVFFHQHDFISYTLTDLTELQESGGYAFILDVTGKDFSPCLSAKKGEIA